MSATLSPLRTTCRVAACRALVPAAVVAALLCAGCVSAERSGTATLGLKPVATPGEGGVAAGETRVPETLTKSSPRRIDASGGLFDADAAVSDAKALAAFGSRPGGSPAEKRAADYIERRLREIGLDPSVTEFRLPNGKTSRNVFAKIDGASSDRTIVLGAHFDTKPPSPGANDNASGCAIALELARVLRAEPAPANVVFAFYGTEEFLLDAPGDNHHLGSRAHAASLSESELDDIAAMVSIDMAGYGTRFHVRTMKKGPQSLSDYLLAQARQQGVALTYKRDPGRTGWSDHEPFERRGVPAAWLQWLTDPTYHTPADDADHLQRRPIATTGEFVLGTVYSLGPRELERLCDRK